MSPLDPQVLRERSVFQLLDDAEMAELSAHVDEATFAAGETVFAAGHPGGGMHVVLSGRVEVSITDADDERVVLQEVGKGGIFGELSLFDGEPRSATRDRARADAHVPHRPRGPRCACSPVTPPRRSTS